MPASLGPLIAFTADELRMELARRGEAADPLRWTTERPTAPGWYWTCQAGDEPSCVEIVRRTGLVYHCHPDGGMVRVAAMTDTEWAGPIPDPLEPAAVRRRRDLSDEHREARP